LLAVYLPNTWVFWIDYPYNDYRWVWIKLTALLPAMLGTAWLMQIFGLRNHLSDAWNFVILGAVTACIVAAGVHLGRRSRRWLLAVCITMFAVQVFNAMGCYALLRM